MKVSVPVVAFFAAITAVLPATAQTSAQTPAPTAAEGTAPEAAVEQEISGDAAAGEKAFRKCRACHTVGADAKNRVGPILNGIVGRPAATVEGFAYSDALRAAAEGGLVWTPEELSAFLENPKQHIKGTKMVFAGLRKEEERADVIAYLAQFDAEG